MFSTSRARSRCRQVTCASSVCTLASLASGASVSGTFQTVATQVGAQVNVVTVEADQNDPTPGDNAASAELHVEGTDVQNTVPLLECVEQLQQDDPAPTSGT